MDNYKSDKIKEILIHSFIFNEKITLEEAVEKAIDDNTLTLCDSDFFNYSFKFIHDIKSNNSTGDIVLIGIWKGGAAMYIKQLLDDLQLKNRLFLIDTFEGFSSPPNPIYKKDYAAYCYFVKKFPKTKNPSINDVLHNFKLHHVNTENIFFIKATDHNLFNQIKEISFLHIDVDMYEPTLFYLNQFYANLLPNYYVIVDDYGVDLFNCCDATDFFINQNKILKSELNILKNIAFWKKN